MTDTISLDSSLLPSHIGIIMDGNGRWAQSRNLIRTQGHLEGLKTAKRIVKAASGLGIKHLSLYVFSTENWKRTVDEVSFIMGLVRQHLRGELDFYRENGIRIRHTGDPAGLPSDIAAELRSAAEDTRSFGGLQVILALNYGGRDEILRAIRKLLNAKPDDTKEPPVVLAGSGKGPSVSGGAGGGCRGITEEQFRLFLDNPDIPDPDLIIRTAGEFRVSNFLLWEGAYSEYYISPKWWPDFTEEDLYQAVRTYQNRERRFGGIKK
ncbi:MAG: di-trans,poly-cis-decaprenylcistransferase [Treponema sp.]|jgi:undecaprenyl diphosphate synthase|nr:di-trans,poly-cis-decaprenylcistransferase [Treponema sp.]